MVEAPTSAVEGWVGAAREVGPVDPLELGWGEPTFYWERPADGELLAGFGVAAEWTSSHGVAEALRSVAAAAITWRGEAPEAPGPWFGGMAFDAQRSGSGIWAGFPSVRWLLPERAVCRAKGRTWLTSFAPVGARIEPPVLPLREVSKVSIASKMEAIVEDRASWDRLVGQALAAFAEGSLSKVVGARMLEVRLDSAPQLRGLLSSLRAKHPTCSVFLLRGTEGSAFLGATPETLLRNTGGRLSTEALAGTVARDAPAEAVTEKELREHGAVLRHVLEVLSAHGTYIEAEPQPQRVKLRHLAHLRTRVTASLSSSAALGEVVAALHPTPAVGGTPREAALDFLRREEGMDRGWYAGALGWMGPHSAHLAVALRCALVRGRQAWIYVGAGLVEGSDPEKEWVETRFKAQTMLEALGGAASDA